MNYKSLSIVMENLLFRDFDIEQFHQKVFRVNCFGGCPAAFIPGKIKGLQGGGSSAKMGRRVQPSNVRQPLHFHREIDPAYQTIDPPKVYKYRYLEFQTCFAFCCFRYQNNCTADCGGCSFSRGTDGWQSIAILLRCVQSQTIFFKDDLIIFYED